MSNTTSSFNANKTIVGGGGVVRPQTLTHKQLPKTIDQYFGPSIVNDGYGSSDNEDEDEDEKQVTVLPSITELQVKIDNANKMNKFNQDFIDAKRDLEKQYMEKKFTFKIQEMLDLDALLNKTVVILQEDKCIQCCFDDDEQYLNDDVEVLPLTEEEKKALISRKPEMGVFCSLFTKQLIMTSQ
jgi:hypothetical protein